MSFVVGRRERCAVKQFARQYNRITPFIDRVKALVCSGSGGDGAATFMHVCNNEFAGPGGGNGGRGGNVYLRCTRAYPDLSHILALGSQIRANNGRVGYNFLREGRRGSDIVLNLPIGTQVVDVDTNDTIFDLETESMEVLLLDGGAGGKGNARFANKMNHSPKESTRGLPGNTMLCHFELKSIADVGLVGFPNAGKSSLLGAISSSKPKVAPYAFTTIHPTIGQIHDLYGSSCLVADLPGLIEGAYENRGLGHQFLRHVERTIALAYVVDMVESYIPTDRRTSQNPWEVVETLHAELEYYLPGLSDRAIMVFANKMDVEKDSNGTRISEKFLELQRRCAPLPVFPVSAQQGLLHGTLSKESGLTEPMNAMCNLVFDAKKRRADQVHRTTENLNAELVGHTEQQYGAYFAPVKEEYLTPINKNAHKRQQKVSSVPPAQTTTSKMLVLDAAVRAPLRNPLGRHGLVEHDTLVNFSLVDQQLDSEHGNSGYGVPLDVARHHPLSGNVLDLQDLSLGGKYWTLTRNPGERLQDERWR